MNKKLFLAGFILLLVISIFSAFKYNSDRQVSILTQEDAINAVIKLHPELASYRTTSLPPSSIEAKETAEGWYVGFIQSGSGIPGILNAKCYQVRGGKNVVSVGTYVKQNDKTVQSIALDTCSPIFAEAITPAVLPYGYVTLALNQRAIFKDISIRPLSIEEDSRCPNDVQCIQVGTVRVRVEVASGMGTSTSILKLGQVFTTEAQSVTLKIVMPDKNSKVMIADADYRLTFNVVPQESLIQEPQKTCYVGGCSGQLCSDQPDIASTCEYKEEYACYKSSTCRRQSNGECGWTQTAELSACLTNSRR